MKVSVFDVTYAHTEIKMLSNTFKLFNNSSNVMMTWLLLGIKDGSGTIPSS